MQRATHQPPARETNSGKVGKRNRPPTSCEPCRIRKLKCDRASPCDSCVKRKKQSSCEYADNANRNQAKRNTGDRLQNLENMVLQFVQNGAIGTRQDQETNDHNANRDQSNGYTRADDNTPSNEHGTLHARNGGMIYVDSSHWLSILQDIKEVRGQLSLSDNSAQETDQPLEDDGPQPEADLMFGLQEPLSIHQILLSLPPRNVCDSLLSQYFNLQYFVLPILHPLKFQKEYEQFWQDPPESPTLWIGLLFSILGMAATLRRLKQMPMDPAGRNISPDIFRLRTTQCLVLGKYSTAKAYGLETLVLHLQNQILGLVDSQINVWFYMGIVIRLAMRMGYHRDPKNHSSISPFEGEIRRRIWSNIYQLDILMSFQLGLPSMIPTDYCDTEEPRNLNFSDIPPDIAALPPSRPLTDHTPVLYFILKGKIMAVFKKIVAHTSSLSSPPIETTVMLDMEMRETYNNIPSDFKAMSVSRSFMDTPSTIMKRFSIELLYLKGIIVLHRQHLNKDTSNFRFAKFRQACVEAAMDILTRQADLHEAVQPGGQLSNDQWMISPLTTHDFLLAAMVLCLELSLHVRTATVSRDTEFARRFDALQTSHMIWVCRSAESKEARTAAQALELMIRKVKGDNVDNSTSSTLPEDFNLAYAEPVTEMIDGSEDLNWTLLDQYFQNNNGLQDINPPIDAYSEGQGGDPFQGMGVDWMI